MIKNKKKKHNLYPILTVIISVMSIIWMGYSVYSGAIFAGLGEAVVTLFAILPFSIITGGVYVGYHKDSSLYKAIYCIIMGLIYALALFIEQNIRTMVETKSIVGFNYTIILQTLLIAGLVYLLVLLGELIKHVSNKIKFKHR